MKKFEEIGVVKNIGSPVHYRFPRSTANNAIVSESITEKPNVSIPRGPQELGQP